MSGYAVGGQTNLLSLVRLHINILKSSWGVSGGHVTLFSCRAGWISHISVDILLKGASLLHFTETWMIRICIRAEAHTWLRWLPALHLDASSCVNTAHKLLRRHPKCPIFLQSCRRQTRGLTPDSPWKLTLLLFYTKLAVWAFYSGFSYHHH